MKKTWVIILVVALVVVVLGAIYFGRKKTFDETVTLKRGDKIPYGTYLLFKSLPSLFPKAEIITNSNPASKLEEKYGHHNAYILVSKYLIASDEEIDDLVHFAKIGNDVFISAADWSSYSIEKLGLSMSGNNLNDFEQQFAVKKDDSVVAQLVKPVFNDTANYSFPGKALPCNISSYASGYAEIMGTEKQYYTNFIRMRVGEGNIFIHTQPMCFTNYFLITRNNFRYAEQAFSAMNGNYNTVIWDEYYQRKHEYYDDSNKGLLSAIWKIPAFRNAFLLLLAVLALYALFESKRKQRLIPVMARPRNDSLDFANTMGRLYYETGDNLNLAQKMATYFLEHVRTRFRLATSELNEAFTEKLISRSGATADDVNFIVTFIIRLRKRGGLENEELIEFHKALENFYHQSR